MREATIEAQKPANGALGIELSPDSPLKVTKLLSSSCFLGKLFVGDVILAVNEQAVKKKEEFYKKVDDATTLKIKFERDEYCACSVKPLPSPRKGCELFDLELKWRKGGMPIGILVYQDMQKRVVVSVVESGSLAQDIIKPGDILTMINNITITGGKAGAKKSIYRSVTDKNAVTLTIERQLDAVKAAKSPVKQPPSVIKSAVYDLLLPDDVLLMMANNKDFYTQLYVGKSILKTPSYDPTAPPASLGSASKSSSHTSISSAKPGEEPIEFDPGSKPLRSTPKRLGS